MTTDDIVERIRKLMRLAEDAGATKAEAASALERANALLIRHNLTLDKNRRRDQRRQGAGYHRAAHPHRLE